MSLDVGLYGKWYSVQKTCECCGHTEEALDREELYEANITHNLVDMAIASDLYYACWKPDEMGWKKAKDIYPALCIGLKNLESKPDLFRQYDSENGWGTYKDFIRFVHEYMDACAKYPDAVIEVSR